MESVIELKKDIENDEDIKLILIKALNISSKLGLKDYEKWIISEIQGYDNPKELPSYRIITCEVLYNVIENPMQGATLNPLDIGLSPKFNEFLNKLFLKKPINIIEEYYATQEDPIQFKASANINQTINQITPINVEIYRQFPLAKLKNIMEQVKTHIYLMCLELEKHNLTEIQLNEKNKTPQNINLNAIVFNIDKLSLNITNTYNNITTLINNSDIDHSTKIEIINNMKIIKEETQKENPNTNIIEKSGTSLNELALGVSSSLIAQGIISFVSFIFQIYHIIPIQ